MIYTYKFLIALLLVHLNFGSNLVQEDDDRFVTYVTKPAAIELYWKNEKGEPLRSIQNLKLFITNKGRTLKFAMNGGMYTKEHAPQGLYVENNIVLSPLDTLSGNGNFYLKPNGVFYISSDNEPVICKTVAFKNDTKIKFATQSGPMLLIDGEIHPAFKKGSANLNIRNGVGILPDNRVIFAMSKKEINFYEFAEFFKSMKCKNALYLDGFVSRSYLPEKKWEQQDGDFGVLIGVSQ